MPKRRVSAGTMFRDGLLLRPTTTCQHTHGDYSPIRLTSHAAGRPDTHSANDRTQGPAASCRTTSDFRPQSLASKLLHRAQGWHGPPPTAPQPELDSLCACFSRSWARAPGPVPRQLSAATRASPPGPAEKAAASALGVSVHCTDEELYAAWQAKLHDGSCPPIRSRWQRDCSRTKQHATRSAHQFVSTACRSPTCRNATQVARHCAQGTKYAATRHYNQAYLTLRIHRYPIFEPFSAASTQPAVIWRQQLHRRT